MSGKPAPSESAPSESALSEPAPNELALSEPALSESAPSESALSEWAEQYGTPLYVYDLDRVRAARQALAGWLPAGFDIYYSLKANPHPELAAALREPAGGVAGCRAEVSSTGELECALLAGYPADEVLYTGPGKTGPELAEAIANGVRMFSAESLTDLQHVGAAACAAGVLARCLLRINSDAAAAAPGIRMTGKPSQFGIDSETVAGLAGELRAVPGTTILGLHLYSQSDAKSEDALIEELRHTVELAGRLAGELDIRFEVLDIGGGFAVPYGRSGERAQYPRLRAALEAALDECFPAWRAGTPRLAVESGRYLVGDSGTLVSRVSNVKTSRGQTYVILDAGVNTFGGMSGLGRTLPVSVEPASRSGPDAAPAFLVGPLCTPGDILARGGRIRPLQAGELVIIPNAGAYGVTASPLMFLGRPAPVELVVQAGAVLSCSRLEHRRSYR